MILPLYVTERHIDTNTRLNIDTCTNTKPNIQTNTKTIETYPYQYSIDNNLQVCIGELVTQDAYSISPISWRGLTLRPMEDDEAESKRETEKFSTQLKSFLRYEKSV